jgi:hypothetical protein
MIASADTSVMKLAVDNLDGLRATSFGSVGIVTLSSSRKVIPDAVVCHDSRCARWTTSSI